MNKEFKKMSCLLSGMLIFSACGLAAANVKKEENIFHPTPEITPLIPEKPELIIPEDLAQNIEEIDTDPTVEGTYDLYTITYYCGCDICNGSWGAYDALGNPLEVGTIACNTLPLGTVVYIDNQRYVVRDRLSPIYDGENRIDIYVEDHDLANELGIRYNVEVFIENY